MVAARGYGLRRGVPDRRLKLAGATGGLFPMPDVPCSSRAAPHGRPRAAGVAIGASPADPLAVMARALTRGAADRPETVFLAGCCPGRAISIRPDGCSCTLPVRGLRRAALAGNG
jgi:hypothetical protein